MHDSDWAIRINDDTRELYPLPTLPLLASLLAGPFLFRWALLRRTDQRAVRPAREHLRARGPASPISPPPATGRGRMRASAEPVTHIHSQWAHSCGTIAMYGGWLLDKSVQLHRPCHRPVPRPLRAGTRSAAPTSSSASPSSTASSIWRTARGPSSCVIVYCGINPEWFHPPRRRPAGDRPYRVLASGRLVEKKGFAY
jgi:glycosyltransferase involved in cell wall biosynthesis